MKTNEILEGNRILAEFMGGKPYCNATLEVLCNPSGIFHLSWDWLMPVVEKIEALGYDVEIGSQYVRIDGGQDNGFGIDSWYSGSKIKLVFTACVEFAKWYKNQTK